MNQGKLFSFQNMQFDYEPYPIGYAPRVLSDDLYRKLCESYPPLELFACMSKETGKKYSLSEVNHPDKYYAFLKNCPIWQQAYEEVKSRHFLSSIIELLADQNIDIGLKGRMAPVNRATDSWRRRICDAWSCLRRGRPRITPLKSRFEFSMMSADGGNIRPHTDSPNKLVTLVISMIGDGEWNPAFGGGTSVLRPTDERKIFNHRNKYLDFDETLEIKTFPFNPNQCVLFIKTFNSLHAVRPMTGTGSSLLRKTLTINLETYQA